MKTFTTLAATTGLLLASTSVALADGHADVLEVTCADFAAMEIADQESFMAALGAALPDEDNDDMDIEQAALLCNGNDEKTVGEVLDLED